MAAVNPVYMAVHFSDFYVTNSKRFQRLYRLNLMNTRGLYSVADPEPEPVFLGHPDTEKNGSGSTN